MNNGIKRTVELAQNEMVPLKSSSGEVLSEKNQQMKIWMEQSTLCRLCKTQFITATALDIMSLIQNQQQKTWPQEDPSVPGITVQEFRTATPTLLLERKKRATAH